MSILKNVKTKNEKRPNKIVVHSLGGVGKSTFGVRAARAKNGILLLGEDGVNNIKEADGVPRLELSCWDYIDPEVPNGISLKAALKTLMVDDHEYGCVVIDTLDSLVPSLDDFVIQKFYKGDAVKADAYKQKYTNYVREFTSVIKGLDYLVNNRNMEVVTLVHSVVSNHRDPASEAWKRWEFNLPGGDRTDCRALVYDWADIVLYASRDVEVEDRKGYGGDRIAFTDWSPAYDAKNRFDLPSKIPFEYEEFNKLISEEG